MINTHAQPWLSLIFQMDLEPGLIPSQKLGAQSETESSIDCPDKKECDHLYEVVKQRLFTVNNWHDYAGKLTAVFQLTDENGVEVNRHAQREDYFRIDIPAPGSQTGDGYDWVRVEEVKEGEEQGDRFVAIRVRPAPNPGNDNKDVAHFFTDQATSSFVVKQEGNKLIAAVYGRNEKPNTDAEKVMDKTRNALVASGAVSGFSKLQWKSLVEGLLDVREKS